MIRLNIISRIAGDKDFFSHYLETVTEIFSENNITIFVNFIGPIEDLNTYNKIIKYCTKHGIEKQISFTKKALPYCEIENTEKDVFLNASIGSFIGYSSIESIENSFKTIFFNVDETSFIKKKYISFCQNKTEFKNLILKIVFDNNTLNLIEKENKEIFKSFHLDTEEKQLLLNILNGKI